MATDLAWCYLEEATDNNVTELVLAHLQKVEASELFRNAPVLKRFLRFVVEETLAGRSGHLNVGYVAKKGLGKATGFSNELDSSVRVSARRLRQNLALYYSGEGRFDELRICLSSGSYVPQFEFLEHAEEEFEEHDHLFANYYRSPGKANLEMAMNGLRLALSKNPEDASALAKLAELHLDSHVHWYDRNPRHLDQAFGLAEQARSFGALPDATFVSALIALESGDTDQVVSEANALSKVDVAGDYAGFDDWLLGIVDPQYASESLMPKGADQIGWLYHPYYLKSLADQDFEAALSSAISFQTPGLFWGNANRAVALSKLGLDAAARGEYAAARALCPALDIETDAVLKSFIPQQELRSTVVETLKHLAAR